MSFEEEFDKIIRQKAEDAQFPFDENNWEKASRMLDADKKVRRIVNLKKFYMPAAIILVVGTIGFISLANLGGSFNSSNLADQQIINDKALLTAPHLPSETSSINTLAVPENKINSEKSNSLIKSQTEILPVTSVESANSEVSIASIKANKINPTADVLKTLQESNVLKNNKVNEKINTPPANNQTLQETNVATYQSKESTSSVEEVMQTPENETAIPDKNKTILGSTMDESSSKLEVDKLEQVYTSLPNQTDNEELYPTTFHMLARYSDDYFKGRRPKTHYLNVEAGGMYSLGWYTKDGKDGQGFDCFGGLNYGVYLSKKVTVGIGLQAYNITNIKQAFYNSKKTEYGFGSSSSYTVITSNNLIYAAIPFKVAYLVNASNQFALGVNAGYLVGSRSTETINNGSELNQTKSSKKSRVYEGSQLTNIMLTASYNAQLNKHFALNAEFLYGTTDILKNTGRIKNIEKPMGIRLSLKYTLFDK